jgi:hypothetical protein
LRFQSRKRRSDAIVNPGAKCEMAVRVGAEKKQLVRQAEHTGVTIRRSNQERHGLARADEAPVAKINIGQRDSAGTLNRAVEPQKLFNRTRGNIGPFVQQPQLIRVAQQR